MNKSECKKIIKNNIEILYKIDKYKYLSSALKSDGRLSMKPKKLLFKIWHFLEDREMIPDKEHDRWSFFLTTDTITELRKNWKYNKDDEMLCSKYRKQQATSNRYINYLSAIGVINKMYQPFFMEYKDIMELTEVNRNFLLNSIERNIPINFFYINPYTEEELQRLDDRAKQLLDAKLTPGKQWSKATLQARHLESIAEELYKRNNDVIAYKTSIYNYMRDVIQHCIDNKGYASKEDLSSNMLVCDRTIENILRIFKPELLKIYNYKRPTKQEKELYKLNKDSFIFTIKGE